MAAARQFPIPVANSPEGRGARPMNPPSAGAGEREVPRVTNVHDPRRSFFLCFPRGHISVPALVAREILNSISSAHHRLRFRQQGTTGTFEDVQKAFAKEANV
jgi:hypothetical protein